MKKLLILLFTTVLSLNAMAQEGLVEIFIPKSLEFQETVDPNIKWKVDEDWTLTITGAGEMPNFQSEAPWHYAPYTKRIKIYSEGNVFFSQDIDMEGKLPIKKIIIDEGITHIGSRSFFGLGDVTSVKLPSSLTSIGEDAFNGCRNLSTLDAHCDLSTLTIERSAFNGCIKLMNTENGALYIGKKLIRVFSSPEVNSISIDEGTTEICANAFKGNQNITSITIPESVTIIGDNAFSDCSSLSDFTLNANDVTFGSNVFAGCSSLPSDGTYRKAGKKVIVKVEDKSKVKYTISGDIKFIAENAFDGTEPKFIEFEGPTAPQIKTNSLPTDYTTIVDKAHASNFNGFKNVNTTKIDLTQDKLTTCTFLHDAVIPDGIAVYRAKVDDGGDVINLYKLNADNKSISIKKGQGVILKAYSGAQYTFNMANTASDIKGDNDIKGCLNDTYLYGSENAFGIKTIDNKQHFIRINSKTTIPAGKAYIQGSSNTASQVRFQYDDLEEEGAMWETSIEDINAESNSNSRIYNMSGQRLSSAQKGLNIIDGKIVMK